MQLNVIAYDMEIYHDHERKECLKRSKTEWSFFFSFKGQRNLS